MLVIPDNMKKYVQEVEEWAAAQGLREVLNAALLRMHLYGGSWSDLERARVTLYAKDYAPKSFLYSIEFNNDGEYKSFISGGLIFHGEIDADGRLKSRDKYTGWDMHS